MFTRSVGPSDFLEPAVQGDMGADNPTTSLDAERSIAATAVTCPEVPAVRFHDPPRLQAPEPSIVPTAVTHPEMPAVLVEDTRPSRPSVTLWDDDETTDVTRLADLGPPPEVRDRAVFVRMDGTQAGQVVSLGDATCTVGRHRENDFPIRDYGISRHHARIARDAEGHHVIEDVGSRNGTYVQGRRVTRHRLRDGDWVQLGPRVTLRYSVTDEQQEKLLRQLFELSTRDALTGAYNRQYLEERLRSEIAYATRHQTNMALVLFDLDHFKRINDTCGHQAGDHVLRSIAIALSARLRAEDVFARYGGEEFVVLLRSTDIDGAARVAERMRAAVERLNVSFGDSTLHVSISAGCASLTCCRESTGVELVGVADRRLYAAKHTGRNRVVACD